MNHKAATSWMSIVCISVSLLCFTLHCFAGDEDARQKKLVQKLNTITIPGLKYREAMPSDLLAFLSDESRRLDPEKVGVNIILEGVIDETKVTISANNLSLFDAVKYICQLAGLTYRIDPNAVIITKGGKTESLAQVSELPTNITVNGDTYEDVRWRQVTPTTVTIFHKTGVATIPLASLPPTLQQRFGYDPQKAAEFQAAEDANAAKALASRDRFGRVWHVAEYEAHSWSGVWVRRGNSLVFDAELRSGDAQINYVVMLTVQGNTIYADRVQDGHVRRGEGPHSYTYVGTISGNSVSGRPTFGDNPNGGWDWYATIEQ